MEQLGIGTYQLALGTVGTCPLPTAYCTFGVPVLVRTFKGTAMGTLLSYLPCRDSGLGNFPSPTSAQATGTDTYRTPYGTVLPVPRTWYLQATVHALRRTCVTYRWFVQINPRYGTQARYVRLLIVQMVLFASI